MWASLIDWTAGNAARELGDKPGQGQQAILPLLPINMILLHLEGAGVGDAGFAGFAALDAADAEEFFAALFEVGFNGAHIFRRDDEDHADAHVERLQQLIGINLSELGEIFENGRHGPGGQIDFGFNAARQNAREISWNAATGNVRHRRQPAARDDVFQSGGVAEMRFQELGADLVADFSDIGVRLQPGDFENEFAREGIPVGVKSGRGEREQRVAGGDVLAGEELSAFDGADDESGEIVFAGRIKPGHFRGFAADESAARFAARAAHAFDELLDDLWIELAHREIVQKKKRLGALHENVIDAVIDEVA